MKAIICEMCNSNQLRKDNDVYVCQNCGTQYTVGEAKKLLIEIQGSVDISGSTVKIDRHNDFENYIKIARNAKSVNDYSKALQYYEKAYEIDPDNWEAAFFTTVIQCATFTIEDLVDYCLIVHGNNRNVLRLLKAKISSNAEIKDALNQMKDALFVLTNDYHSALTVAYSDYVNGLIFNKNDKTNLKQQYRNGMVERGNEIINVLLDFGDEIEKVFGYSCAKLVSVPVWKNAIEKSKYIYRYSLDPTSSLDRINNYISKVVRYDTSYSRTPLKISNIDPDYYKNLIFNIFAWTVIFSIIFFFCVFAVIIL